jgi:hypothetical protein
LAEAKELRRLLAVAGMSIRWVPALLVTTKSTIPDVRIEFRYVTLVGASDVVALIRDRDRMLSPEQVSQAVEAIAGNGSA